MTDDPRIAYLNARMAYEAALKLTKAHARLISGVGEQIARDPAAFIAATLDRKPTGQMHTAWDLSRWPSADELRRDVEALKSAFYECQAHWAALPVTGRGGCVPPPSKLGAD